MALITARLMSSPASLHDQGHGCLWCIPAPLLDIIFRRTSWLHGQSLPLSFTTPEASDPAAPGHSHLIQSGMSRWGLGLVLSVWCFRVGLSHVVQSGKNLSMQCLMCLCLWWSELHSGSEQTSAGKKIGGSCFFVGFIELPSEW